jgi:hypothetical protein
MSGGELENFYEYMFYEWSEKIKADAPVFSRIIHDLGDVLHKYDYWISGDVSKEDFLRAWAEFCKKWSIEEPNDLEGSVLDYW